MSRSSPSDPQHDPPDRAETVRLYVDHDSVTFYIDALPGYTPPALAVALRRARLLGLEALDPDDDDIEAEDLGNGSKRIWLAEVAELDATSAP